MTLEFAGRISTMTPQESLVYWIEERYTIYGKKLAGESKPWSADPVFQRTYFCNVRREDDKVTRAIRNLYPYTDDPMFEYNIVLSRFLNWPPTLFAVGYQHKHDPDNLLSMLNELAGKGKVWGGAYVITTHGLPMPKATYLCHEVLEAVHKRLDSIVTMARQPPATANLRALSRALQGIEGIGSFLAGQIVADLKNTPNHPCEMASDWWTFVEPGPGSLRGLKWFFGDSYSVRNGFLWNFLEVRDYVNRELSALVPYLCNQDLQNCLCEYDKYMRVKNGTGRSKRNYEGH